MDDAAVTLAADVAIDESGVATFHTAQADLRRGEAVAGRVTHGGTFDTRRSEVYDALPFRIPNSVRLAPEEVSSGVSGLELDVSAPLIAYCTDPNEATSAKVAAGLRKLGFKDVRILKGGLGAWTNAGLPIESRSDISAVGLELYKALAGGNG